MIGLILGLTGGGGSILTVPVLVYLLGYNPVLASAYSLFIVGTTAGFGTILNSKKGIVEFETAIKFAIPSLIAVFLTRKFLIPFIPDEIITFGSVRITKSIFLMVFFAIIMLQAAYSMLFKTQTSNQSQEVPLPIESVLKRIGIGVIIGLVGAGGGFLIIPALVFVEKLPMKKAVGTSLLIIAINSLIGFLGDVGNLEIDWKFLFTFSVLAIAGINIGVYLNRFVNDTQLKKGFGWFVLLMAILILYKELWN